MAQFFSLDVKDKIATLTFARPPVNAFSYDVYRDLIEMADEIEKSDEIAVVVLTGSPESRAWVGGADLRDLVELDPETRKERYKLVNASLPRLYNIDRPVIAAINGPAVGVGVSVAAMCDIRVCSKKAFFAKPEIDRGLVASGGIQITRLNLPVGVVREMIYTARRFTAEELAWTGFFNYLVEPEEVLPKAMEIAAQIATKSLPALKANKICNNAVEGMPWQEGYKLTQDYSAMLTGMSDAKEGIRAFLEKRRANYQDR
jgi:enoyl-CoA hydratase